MSKYARRVDCNQKEIVNAFKQLGCSVFDTSRVAGGYPDLTIGKNGKTILVEIKRDLKATFTKSQQEFMDSWKGSTVCRVQDIDGVITIVKMLDKV